MEKTLHKLVKKVFETCKKNRNALGEDIFEWAAKGVRLNGDYIENSINEQSEGSKEEDEEERGTENGEEDEAVDDEEQSAANQGDVVEGVEECMATEKEAL